MIGSLSQLIRGAAILAIADGSEQITRDLLEAVPVDYDQRAEPDINALHPFREGNGRAQQAFFSQLAHDAGHCLGAHGP